MAVSQLFFIVLLHCTCLSGERLNMERSRTKLYQDISKKGSGWKNMDFQLVKDVGTMLEGEEAVREGLIDEVGGIRDALDCIFESEKKKIITNMITLHCGKEN